uniref:Uncharacterized protein n=1 Tax=Timema cristinae TaxID=61476 RepID=A0A7R9H757_TIMCR|nr:unnamed protein product [Timema cristinae]
MQNTKKYYQNIASLEKSSGVVAGHIFRTDSSHPMNQVTYQMPDSSNPATLVSKWAGLCE